ncbi:DUF2523 family protein [Pseudomonas sp.]|uniref:DUF2523 family protein n=1 Tax=Pseudomonas sp. TaxID=306 RepID=UPI00333E4FC5
MIRAAFSAFMDTLVDAPAYVLTIVAAALFVLCALIRSDPAHAACGYVNGNYICTDKPGCGLVNGVERCATPAGCGYVNGEYRCNVTENNSDGTPATPGIYKPKAGDASKPNAGTVAGLEWIANFFAGKGADDWLSSALGWFSEKLVTAWLDTKLWFMKIGWSVAKSVLTDLGVFAGIASAISGMPAEIRAALNFFQVFQAISIILTAGMTKFVLRFIPGA